MKRIARRDVIGNIIIFIIALVTVCVGIGLYYMSDIANREDIKLYNQAIAIYDQAELTYDADLQPLFPVENILQAASQFQQLASTTTDSSLKTLALYNIGTMVARDYLIFTSERIPGLGIAEAIILFEEVVRTDPDNEDAKYNLEYLKKILSTIPEEAILKSFAGSAKAGYILNKGY